MGLVQMANCSSPENNSQRAVDFQAQSLREQACCRIIRQQPVGADLLGKRNGFGLARLQQTCSLPGNRLMNMTRLQHSGDQPNRSLIEPVGDVACQLCVHRRRNVDVSCEFEKG